VPSRRSYIQLSGPAAPNSIAIEDYEKSEDEYYDDDDLEDEESGDEGYEDDGCDDLKVEAEAYDLEVSRHVRNALDSSRLFLRQKVAPEKHDSQSQTLSHAIQRLQVDTYPATALDYTEQFCDVPPPPYRATNPLATNVQQLMLLYEGGREELVEWVHCCYQKENARKKSEFLPVNSEVDPLAALPVYQVLHKNNFYFRNSCWDQ
jgi:hypothetical protein